MRVTMTRVVDVYLRYLEDDGTTRYRERDNGLLRSHRPPPHPHHPSRVPDDGSLADWTLACNLALGQVDEPDLRRSSMQVLSKPLI